jgi:hypothetical protein
MAQKAKGKIPPQFLKHMKKKGGQSDADAERSGVKCEKCGHAHAGECAAGACPKCGQALHNGKCEHGCGDILMGGGRKGGHAGSGQDSAILGRQHGLEGGHAGRGQASYPQSSTETAEEAHDAPEPIMHQTGSMDDAPGSQKTFWKEQDHGA